MAKEQGLISLEFVAINLQFALITAIAALFFAFAGYLHLLGIDAASTGVILSADALAALILQPCIAPMVHQGTARTWLVSGCLLLAVALLLLPHVTSVALLIAVRLLQGAGFICALSALIALLVHCIPPEMSGRAFGWVSLVRLIPYAVIPFVFDLLAIGPAAFPPLLHVAALVALCPLLLLLLPATRHTPSQQSPPPGWAGLVTSLRSPAVVLLLVSTLLFFCGYATIFFFLKQFVGSRGMDNPSLFFTTATLMMIAVRLGTSWLFDRCNKRLVCAGGLLLVALCYALLPACGSTTMLALLAMATGLGWGIAMPLQAAAMFDLSLPTARAMNQNLLVVMMQGGFFLGPFLGGQVLAHCGFSQLFLFLAVLTSLAAGLLLMQPQAPGKSEP